MIIAENVEFGYERKKPFITSLNLHIERGKAYGLFGPNFAGKTTLLKLSRGSLLPWKGTIRYREDDREIDVTRRDPSFLGKIHVVPEIPPRLPMSAARFAATLGPFYPKFDFAAYAEATRRFGIDDKTEIQQLPMTKRRMVFFAFGLAADPELWFLDEPDRELDADELKMAREAVAGHLAKGRTVILSSSGPREFEGLCDRLIFMDRGKIVLERAPDAAFDIKAFLREMTRETAGEAI